MIGSFVTIFCYTSIHPAPVLAAEAAKEWHYQYKLHQLPESPNPSLWTHLYLSAGNFFGDLWDWMTGDEGAEAKKKKQNSPVDFQYQQAPKGEKWDKPKRVRELVKNRKENVKYHQLSDGRIEAEISSTPLHYRDSKGQWQEIDPTITQTKENGFPYGSTKNHFQTYFGNQSNAPIVKVKGQGFQVDLGVTTPKTGEPSISTKQNKIVYENLLSEGKLEYEVLSDSVKEKIILEKAPITSSYEFNYQLAGVTAKQQKDGSIQFIDSQSGVTKFIIPKPFMYDNQVDSKSPYGFTWSPKVTQTIQQDGTNIKLTLQADSNWLRDPKRKYPVVIDPTIVIQPLTGDQPQDAQSTTINNNSPTSNFYWGDKLSVGSDPSQISRSLVKFDLSSIDPNTIIDSARLDLYYDRSFCNGCVAGSTDNKVDISVHQVTQDWDPKTVTWNQAKTGIPWPTTGGDFNTSLEYNAEFIDSDNTTKTTRVGRWAPIRTSTTNAYKGSYYISDQGTGAETFTWFPTLTESGNYELFVHQPYGTTRATNTPFTVHHSSGTTTVNVNQNTTTPHWLSKGTFNFSAGTSHKIVQSDNADGTVAADAVKLVKYGVASKQVGGGNEWHQFSIRSLAQDWVNGTRPNYGVMVKVRDESKKLGGVHYIASSNDLNISAQNTVRPKLILVFGKPGVDLNEPTTIHSTGAELAWSQYTSSDFVEYQVHRSTEQNFIPNESTLVAPILDRYQTQFTDTTADEVMKILPSGRVNPEKPYYYMVAVKTVDGQLLRSETKFARLPHAGLVRKVIRSTADATLSSIQPTTNLDTIGGKAWMSAGNYDATYGNTRAAMKFDLSSIPVGSKVVKADLALWGWQRNPEKTTTTPNNYIAHAITKDFTKSATWSTPWTTPGGDLSAGLGAKYASDLTGWMTWDTTSAVQDWVKRTKTYYGFLVKTANEGSTVKEQEMFLSSEASEKSLRPKLEVVYTEFSQKAFSAPSTPKYLAPGATYETYVTISNQTDNTWTSADHKLSYHWYNSSGTEITDSTNRLETTFRLVDEEGKESSEVVNIGPGQSIKVKAQIKAPTLSSNQARQSFTLSWDIKNSSGWLSQSANPVAVLSQKVIVEKLGDSKELGASASHVNDYAGPLSKAGVNIYNGNVSFEYDPYTIAAIGPETYVKINYNSLSDDDSVLGKGWSLATNSLIAIGAPATNGVKIYTDNDTVAEGSIIITDEEGGSHTFTYNGEKFVAPPGTNLEVKYISGKDKLRKWKVTEANGEYYYLDELGYVTEHADRNGNKLSFVYEEKLIDNRKTKLLKYLKDASNRTTLTFAYNSKNKLEHIDTLGDRRIHFLYDTSNRLTRITDGIDTKDVTNLTYTRSYVFAYHSTLTNAITKITDPRGHNTQFLYNTTGADEKKVTEMISRSGENTGARKIFRYNANERIVINEEGKISKYLFDEKGRNVQFTNVKNHTTTYEYDNDDNLIKTVDPKGNFSTAKYHLDNSGKLSEKMDAVNNAITDTTQRKKTSYEYSNASNGAWVGDLTKVTSPEGKVTLFTYDSLNRGNLLSKTVTDLSMSQKYETKYTYYPNGLLKSETDARGNTTYFGNESQPNYGYHPSGKPLQVKDANGSVTTFTYGPSGEVLTTKDALNNTTTYTYDILGRVLTTKIPKEGNTFITIPAPVYDQSGNLLEQTSANGAKTTYTYDESDRVKSIQYPIDDIVDPQNPEDKLVNRIKKYEYDVMGRLKREIEPNGVNTTDIPDDFVTTYEYDDVGLLVAVANAKGDKIKYTYDAAGNKITEEQPLGLTTSTEGDYTTQYEYDKNNRLVKTIDPEGRITRTVYNHDGEVVQVVDKEGNVKQNFYNFRGLLSEERYYHDVNDQRITKYTYDDVGNLTAVETPRGTETSTPGDFVQRKTYDKLNRLQDIIFPINPNSLDVTEHVEQKISYKYDAVSNITEVSTPPSYGENPENRIVTSFFYYNNGWLKTIRDPWNIQTDYKYNNLGLETERTVTSSDQALQRKMTWDYHPDGKVKVSQDSGLKNPTTPVFKQKYLTYRYDANNNLIETKDKSTGAKIDTYRLTYTNLNQVDTIEDIQQGTVVRKRDMDYDSNGNLFLQQDPEMVASFFHNQLNQVTKIVTNNGKAEDPDKVTTIDYTPNGAVSKVTKPNNISTAYIYYLDSLLKSMETKRLDGTTIQKHVLEYNANGHRTKDTYTGLDADNKPINQVYTYQYDARDRLIQYDKTGTTTSSERYMLDANSNIVKKIQNGVTTDYTYDKNRLISEAKGGTVNQYAYDSVGRATKITSNGVMQEEYKYDEFDNLIEHQKLKEDKTTMLKTQYAYDALDRTISKTENVGTAQSKKTDYNYLGATDQLISEEVDGVVIRSYQYSPWGERLSMMKKNDQGVNETSYYLNNTDVDVEMLLDEQGNVRATYGYTPYGENDEALFTGVDKPDPTKPDKEMYNPFRYSGKPWDPNTKSYDLGFRNYFPGLGRFLTADSYIDSDKYKGLLMDAANYNVYGFANGNPVSFFDPDGHAMSDVLLRTGWEEASHVSTAGKTAEQVQAERQEIVDIFNPSPAAKERNKKRNASKQSKKASKKRAQKISISPPKRPFSYVTNYLNPALLNSSSVPAWKQAFDDINWTATAWQTAWAMLDLVFLKLGGNSSKVGVSVSDTIKFSRVLNIGSGTNPLKGAVNLSLKQEVNSAGKNLVDVVSSVEKMPFKSGRFNEVYAQNPMYNVLDSEIRRVMMKGGELKIVGNYSNKHFRKLWDMYESGNTKAFEQYGYEFVNAFENAPAGMAFGIMKTTNGKKIEPSTLKAILLRAN